MRTIKRGFAAVMIGIVLTLGAGHANRGHGGGVVIFCDPTGCGGG